MARDLIAPTARLAVVRPFSPAAIQSRSSLPDASALTASTTCISYVRHRFLPIVVVLVLPDLGTSYGTLIWRRLALRMLASTSIPPRRREAPFKLLTQ